MFVRRLVWGVLCAQCLFGQAARFARLPLSFEVNQGQTDPQVQYLVRGGGQTLFLTANRAVLSLMTADPEAPGALRSVQRESARKRHGAAIRMNLLNSKTPDSIEPADPLPGKVNYLIGRDSSQWHTDIPTYGRIVYHGVYPGVDLAYYGTQGSLEYDLIAHPGADANAIQVQFEGADRIRLSPDGDLILDSAAGPVRWKKPYVYQDDHGVRRPIAANYRLKKGNTVEFALARYDRKLALVIDPVLVYSTFMDGTGINGAFTMAVDSTGIYANGATYASDFPTTAGVLEPRLQGQLDAVASKLNPQGNALLYSTYLGGSSATLLSSAVVGSDGSVYLAGPTNSEDFPTTIGAYQPYYNIFSAEMGFVTHLTPTFNGLYFSTYLGGSVNDSIVSVVEDPSGNVYVAGITESYDYPTTNGAFLTNYNGYDNEAFVAKFNPLGTQLLYSTYLGGSGDESVALPQNLQIAPQISYSYAINLAVDASGYAYIGGVTTSCDFPTTSGAFQTVNPCDDGIAYVVKLNTGGTGVVYSTLLGGTTFDAIVSVRVDSTGSVLVTGVTASTNFPTTSGAFSRTYAGGAEDGFAARLNPAGSALTYSTYFGGSDQEAIVTGDLASNGDVLLSGLTFSSNLPTTAGTYQNTYGGGGDCFLTVLDPTLSHLIDSTYVGTSAMDSGSAFFGTGPTDLLLAVNTFSDSFPTTAGAYQTTGRAPSGDGSAVYARFTVNATTAGPSLSIGKSHSGNFAPGQTGAVYTVTVGNASGAAATSGTVTVTENPPAGETLQSMSGSGWSCGGNTCTRSDTLAGGTNYPSITVTVNVSATASSPQVNSVTVTGGGSPNASASDSTIISGAPVLTIAKSHSGNFSAGQQGALYTVLVTNTGNISTAGTVSVVEAVPSGLTLVSMSGSGWSCGGTACQRSDPLGAGTAYPAITVSVNVAASASSPQVNSVTVAGGGAATASTTDSTVISSGATTGMALYPVTPCRVADTRTANGPFGGPILSAGSTRTFTIPSSGCAIPSTAEAYSLNITVVPPAPLGYLTAWPAGQAQPNVSTLNSSNGAVIANAAIVPAGAGGAISIYVSDTTHVIVDINGYFAPPGSAGALAFYPATPCRVADTRYGSGPFAGPSLTAGQTRSFTVPQSACAIPSTAKAYSLNMTVVPPGSLEYLTAWPTGQAQPNVSTLNALQGQIAANAAIVPAGTNGAISVFVSDASNVVVDINGYFAPPGSAGALYFYPVSPCRIADTRTAIGTFGGPLISGGATRTFPIPASSCGLPSTAQAYSLNMTVAPVTTLLYLSTWPAGQSQPVVSTLNDLQGQIVANAAIVPAGNNPAGGISVFVSDSTNLIMDVNGYFGQ